MRLPGLKATKTARQTTLDGVNDIVFLDCIIFNHPAFTNIRGKGYAVEGANCSVSEARQASHAGRGRRGNGNQPNIILSYRAGGKTHGVDEARMTINRMRTRTDRTDGGAEKVGRLTD